MQSVWRTTCSNPVVGRVGLLVLMLVILAMAGTLAAPEPGRISMRGIVMDANTIREPIEYWEVRGASGETVVLTGGRDVPLIKWLRDSKGKRVVLSVEPDTGTSSEHQQQAPGASAAGAAQSAMPSN